MIKFILMIFFSLSAYTALSEDSKQSFDIQDRLLIRDKYLSVYDSMFGLKEHSLAKEFKKSIFSLDTLKELEEAKLFIQTLDPIIPKKFLMPLTYWRFIDNDPEKQAQVLSFFMMYKFLLIRDYIDNPSSTEPMKEQGLKFLKEASENKNIDSNSISTLLVKIEEKALKISNFSNHTKFLDEALKEKWIKQNYKKTLPDLPDYVLNYQGFIPGNHVEIISKNERNKKRIAWYNSKVFFGGAEKLNMDSPHIKMPTKESPKGHIAFTTDPIFIKIRDMIAQSTESIFIDIFLFGGTLGATISEFIVQETLKKQKANPNFKVLILHDYATNYNMVEEIMPVFIYLRDQIKSNPQLKKSLHLLQANIQRHNPGIPFGITNIIPKDPATFKAMQKRNTYYESKIDHSKVIVTDAHTDHPKAYFGSKNWTDHSGGYYYDDAIYVEGPAAAMVQASYYRDVEAALVTKKESPFEYERFYYKDQDLDNVDYLPRKKEILSWFKVTKKHYPYHASTKGQSIEDQGDNMVRFAEADVDGTIKNVRNLLVDMIKSAKKNIYMEQLFIYDKYIIDALIKRKIQMPDLDIKILADDNNNFGLGGLPNSTYMKELISYGIEIRGRILLGDPFTFPDNTTKHYFQENHRKITSVDGKVILGGSSNLNPDTLQGSFREFGAQIFQPKQIQIFEANFLADWEDGDKTKDMNINDLQVIIGEKKLTLESSALINSFIRMVFRSKDALERRHK
jgi:phosphatidylserine/phosphatidylglycerophosphate/cardiolipin synthase-like enzyme